MWAQELGVPYHCLSASEPVAEYRNFATHNGYDANRWHENMQEQNLAAGSAGDQSPSPHWLCMGTPCNPFSVMRSKRFHAESINSHHLSKTTYTEVYESLRVHTPVTATMEQSFGFNRPTSSDDPVTPLDRPGV